MFYDNILIIVIFSIKIFTFAFYYATLLMGNYHKQGNYQNDNLQEVITWQEEEKKH